MNLDDLDHMRALDARGMLDAIDNLPQQLSNGWMLGMQTDLPFGGDAVRQVVIAGMGGSAIGADLLAGYAAPLCSVPLVVHRNYDLPAWASGDHTLVILSSKSGNTEETLSALRVAQQRGCRVLAVTTGGALAEQARALEIPSFPFRFEGQPRAAVGYSFSILLAILARLGLIPDPLSELDETTALLRQLQPGLSAGTPVFRNPAKRMAGQLMGRWVVVFASDALEPVARRWKGQINELAKAWAQFEFLPEADHNTLAGLMNPDSLQSHMMALFLRSESTHLRNLLRLDLTREACMVSGMTTDFYDAPGSSRMAQMWSALQFGDYMAYYLAIAYGADPTEVDILEQFKQALEADS